MAPILETAISLVFVFLVFSLINSWIVEFLSMKLQRRGKFLYEFMTHYLNDKFNKNWGLMLYAHPLLAVLHREVDIKTGFFSFLRNNRLRMKRRLPAYVPSNQLASAMIDLVMKHDVPVAFIKDPSSDRVELLKNTTPDGSQPEPSTALSGRDNQLFQEFLDGLDRLNESEMKTSLVSIARKIDSSSSDKVDQLNSLIAAWFDSSMERLNGWYKRETRQWLFYSGLAIAVFFNVNTLTVVSRLYTDPQTRETVTRAAEAYIKENPEFVPIDTAQNFEELQKRVEDMRDKLAPLPIGWAKEIGTYQATNGGLIDRYVIRPFSLVVAALPDNWIGWLLTALALSYGAPFWFDVLKKFINVRSAGLIPATEK